MKYDNIKLIVIDLDGTLLNDNNQIPEFTLNTFINFQKKCPNIKLVLATGRSFNTTYAIAREIFSNNDFYLILNNGAALNYGPVFKPIKENKMDFHDVKSIFSHNQKSNVHSVVFVRDFKVLIHNGSGFDRFNWFHEWLKNYNYKTEELTAEHNIYQCSAWIPNEDVAEFIKYIKENFKLNLYFYRHPTFTYFELTSEGVNKWPMVKYLINILNINIEDVMAFGNGNNDEQLLKNAGVGLAVKNADEEALAVADKIINSNNNNGVAEFIKKAFL